MERQDYNESMTMLPGEIISQANDAISSITGVKVSEMTLSGVIKKFDSLWYEGFQNEWDLQGPLFSLVVAHRIAELFPGFVAIVNFHGSIGVKYTDVDTKIFHAIEPRVLEVLLSTDSTQYPLSEVVDTLLMRLLLLEYKSMPISDEQLNICFTAYSEPERLWSLSLACQDIFSRKTQL